MTQTMEQVFGQQAERPKSEQEVIERALAYLAILSLGIERKKPEYDDTSGNIVLGYN